MVYYNAHTNRTFTLDPACKSAVSIDVMDPYNDGGNGKKGTKPVLQNECLRSREGDPAKYCSGDNKGADEDNVFCYTLGGGPEHDSWSFNGQHRTGLPDVPVKIYSEEVVAEACEAACMGFNGMEMMKGDALEVLGGYYDLVGVKLESSVVFYPSLPDMCEGCK